MPALSYSYPDFTPNTVISSTKVNAKFNDIKTLLNTTKLDDTNIQNAGITRASKLKTGTAGAVLINDGSGAMSEEAVLSTSRGGLGVALTPSVSDANKVVAVNNSGTAFELQTLTSRTSSNLYLFNRFF